MAIVEVSDLSLKEVRKVCQACEMCPDAQQSEEASGVRVTGILAGVDEVKNGILINCPLINLRTRVINKPNITEGRCADQFAEVFNNVNHRRANQLQFGGQRKRGRPSATK